MSSPYGMQAAAPDGWDGLAYDTAADPQHEWGTAVLHRLVLTGRAVVLDAGCGSGRVTAELLHRYPDVTVTAMDASSSMLDAARERLAGYTDRITLQLAQLPNGLPEQPTFDAIVSTGTFHWIPDHERLFNALYRALNPGGVLLAQCGGNGSLTDVRNALENEGLAVSHLNRYAAAADTAALLHEVGFVDVDCSTERRRVEFATRDDLARYLLKAAIGPYLAQTSRAERAGIARRITDAIDDPVADFVRLNISARRP